MISKDNISFERKVSRFSPLRTVQHTFFKVSPQSRLEENVKLNWLLLLTVYVECHPWILWLVLDHCKPRRTVQVHLTPKKNTHELQFNSHNYVFQSEKWDHKVIRQWWLHAKTWLQDITQSLPSKQTLCYWRMLHHSFAYGYCQTDLHIRHNKLKQRWQGSMWGRSWIKRKYQRSSCDLMQNIINSDPLTICPPASSHLHSQLV